MGAEEQREETPDAVGTEAEADAGEGFALVHD